jgi:chloramphenicol 3-O-phosphotransferase
MNNVNQANTRDPRTAIIVISGTQGAGKTTVAQLLAERFERAAYVSADALQKMIVSGREWPQPHHRDVNMAGPQDEAVRQLRLRLHNMCLLGRSFHEAGFTAILDDIIVGDRLTHVREEFAGLDFMFVLLVPDAATVRDRETQRGSELWREWEWLTESIPSTTERIGLWLDTSEQTPVETVDEIMRRAWAEALIPAVGAEPRLGPPVRAATGGGRIG